MTTALALLLVLLFLVLLGAFGVGRRAGAVLLRVRHALSELRDPALDELVKERAMQAHARALFVAFAVLTGSTLAALALPLGVVGLAALAGLADFDAVVAATMSWPILLVATCAGIGLWWVSRR